MSSECDIIPGYQSLEERHNMKNVNQVVARLEICLYLLRGRTSSPRGHQVPQPMCILASITTLIITGQANPMYWRRHWCNGRLMVVSM